MAENPNLPDEMLIEIFSRLPTRSVGRCRCLSTLWRSRLSNPHFLDLHFTRKPHQQTLILITSEYNSPKVVQTTSLPLAADHAVGFKKLDLPGEKPILRLLGSCNGLVLLMDIDYELYLVNPVTKVQVPIPSSPPLPARKHLIERRLHGFGYDSLSDDYKIVSIAYDVVFEAYDVDFVAYDDPDVFVYSVKRGHWVRNSNFPRLFFGTCSSGALVNGALHWSVCDSERRPVIVVFDLASEEFHVIPNHPYAKLPNHCTTFALGGCLVHIKIAKAHGDITEGWILKEYGLRESWTNFSLAVEGFCTTVPVGEDELLLKGSRSRLLLLYNVKEQTEKQMLFDRGVDCIHDNIVLVDSLVSPHRIAISS